MKDRISVREVRLVLTNRCNFRCYFCFNEGYATEQRDRTLNPSDYLRAVRHLVVKYGATKVRLSGGEPTLDPELPHLVGSLLSEFPGLDIGVTTNGGLPDKLRELLRGDALGRLQVNVSLPAAKAAEFRAMTGSGKLHEVLQSIAIATQSKSRVKINCVVTSRSQAAADVVHAGAQLNVPVKLLCLNVNPHNEQQIGQHGEAVASGVVSIQRMISDLGYRHEGGSEATLFATRGNHQLEIVDCSTSDPIEYFRRFRALRIYFDSHVAVTGDFDGYRRPFDPAAPEAAIDSLIFDIAGAIGNEAN